MKKPNFFVVGNPKSGTSIIYEYLKSHPEIYMSPVKEPRHFCVDFHREEDEFYKNKKMEENRKYKYRSKKEYLDLFSEAKERVVGEASPEYFESSEAPGRIKEFNPRSKIILILRDPVEYIFSSFNQKQSSEESASTFEEALRLEKERLTSYKKVKAPPKSQLLYMRRTNYSRYLKRYLEIFPKKNIILILYEDFKNNNQKEMDRIFRFLEVRPHKIQTRYVNQGKSVRLKALKEFLDKRHMINARRKLKKIFSEKTIKTLTTIYKKIVFGRRKNMIDPRTKKRLKKLVEPEVKKIERLAKNSGLIEKNKDLKKIWGY